MQALDRRQPAFVGRHQGLPLIEDVGLDAQHAAGDAVALTFAMWMLRDEAAAALVGLDEQQVVDGAFGGRAGGVEMAVVDEDVLDAAGQLAADGHQLVAVLDDGSCA